MLDFPRNGGCSQRLSDYRAKMASQEPDQKKESGLILSEPAKSDHCGPQEGDAGEWTQAEESTIRRKYLYTIVPLVTLLYMLCAIDRYIPPPDDRRA